VGFTSIKASLDGSVFQKPDASKAGLRREEGAGTRSYIEMRWGCGEAGAGSVLVVMKGENR